MNNTAKIEALLVVKGEPLSFKYISKQVGVSEDEIGHLLFDLNKQYEDRDSGLRLVVNGDKVLMATSLTISDFIQNITKKDDEAELGNAALETLALILYEGPISKAAIDKIRGVNSSYILRSLMIRGLIERKEDSNSSRNYLYQPTVELIAFLGINNVNELPEKDMFTNAIKDYLNGSDKKDE